MAIKAQGTKFYIGTGTTGAKTITALTQAFRAQVTASGHGLTVGDIGAFASVGGMTEINGSSGVVVAAATNTFCVDIDTRAYTSFTTGGTYTPTAFTQVKKVDSFDWSPGEASDIDVTDFDSTAMEYLSGLPDNGSFQVNINVSTTDAGQAACAAALASGATKDFKLTFVNSATRTFQGTVRSMPESGAVNGKAAGQINIRISGDVTRATS